MNKIDKRIQSFVWRVTMVMLAAGIDAALANLGVFNLPGEFTVVFGLFLGEVSKAIRNEYVKN